jgi:hypothetical protein
LDTDAAIVPTLALPPAIPFTSHVTSVFAEPVTLAWNPVVPPSGTFTDVGDIVTWTFGCIVTIVVVALEGSASGVAVTMMEFGEGALAGA